MKEFEELMVYFKTRHYGELLMLFFEIIAIVSGLIYVRKYKLGIFFLTYLIFDFSLCLFDIYMLAFHAFSKQQAAQTINITNNLIALAELIAYFYFFSKILHNKVIIKILIVSAIIFIVIMGIYLTTGYRFLTNRFGYVTNLVGIVEFLFLIPPCFVYYYELFQNTPTIGLHHRPSFWIVTGIFFYSVISIPYYTLDYFFQNQHFNWPLMYLFFYCTPITINFIFLTKAFLCKKKLTI